MIINKSNTCYLGCVLQCLIHTKSLRRYLQAVRSEDPFAIHFVELCTSVWNNHQTDPTQFYKLIQEKYSYFRNNDHHDAHEAYGVVLERLTQAFPRIQQTMFRHTSKKARVAWSPQRDSHIIDEIFKLMYQIDCVCERCHHAITTYETDYVYYTTAESTENIAGYVCDKCGKAGTTIRTQKLIHFPQTLVIVHTTPVIPALHYKQYRLFAWVNHIKFNESTGHYRAVVRNKDDSKWLLVDDEKVTELTKELPAYMSFYEMIV